MGQSSFNKSLFTLIAVMALALAGVVGTVIWWGSSRSRSPDAAPQSAAPPGGSALAASPAPAVSAPSGIPAPPAPTVDPATLKPTPGVVYEADFSKGAGYEWSERTISTTKDGNRNFLGPFHAGPVTFSVDTLPPHQFIRVQFEMISYERWNGDNPYFGRDVVDIRVTDGQPLIHSSFGNCGFWTNNNEQSFPDQYPWYPTHPVWTGASAKQSLGYMTSQGPDAYGVDSTYAFDLTFPHSADAMDLVFKSTPKGHTFAPYGLLSFKVTTVDHAASADEPTLAGWWNDLSDEDPVKAYNALWKLIATGDTATDYIQSHMPPARTDPEAPPLNIDQQQPWAYGSFQYISPADRQRARAIHVLEVIHSGKSDRMLKAIGFNGTPVGAPPDRWSNR